MDFLPQLVLSGCGSRFFFGCLLANFLDMVRIRRVWHEICPCK